MEYNFNFCKWPISGDEEFKNLADVVKSGLWAGSQSQQLKDVRNNFLKLQKGQYGLPLANGTVTIEAALHALNIGYNDEVIVPALTFYSTVSAVLRANANPVIVDVDQETFCISIKSIKAAITDKTRAIIPVHLSGAMCDMDELKKIADEFNIKIIEDCAHAHGSEWQGEGAGTIGDFGSFSFQHSKLLSSGEGGFLIAKTQENEDHAWNYANCGRISRTAVYEHSTIGTNNRMSSFQAAVLNAQIDRYAAQQDTRDCNAQYIKSHLEDIHGIKIQKYDYRMTKRAYYNFTIIIDPLIYGKKKCSKVFDALNDIGVPTALPYPPLNDLLVFQDYKSKKELSHIEVTIHDVSNAKYASQNSICLHHRVLLSNKDSIDMLLEFLRKLLK